MKKVLILQDIPVDSIEKLRKYFQLDAIYEYYYDGSLSSWLQYHEYSEELQQLSLVHRTTDIAMKKLLLALILGADFNKVCTLNQELLTRYLSNINTAKQSLGDRFQLSDVTHLHVEAPAPSLDSVSVVSISSESTPPGLMKSGSVTSGPTSFSGSGSGQAGGYGLHII